MENKLIVFVLLYAVYYFPGLAAAADGLSDQISAMDMPGCPGTLPTNQPPSTGSQPIRVTAFFSFPRESSAESGSRSLNSSGSDGSYANLSQTANLHYLLPAAVIAVEDVNAALALEGYHLQLDVRATRCDPNEVLYQLISSTEEPRQTSTPHLGIVGPGCLAEIESLSPLAHRFFLPQVAYADEANMPVLGEDDAYQDYFQLVRDVHQITMTALHVMHHFQWMENVAFVYDDNSLFRATVEQLVHGEPGEFVLQVSEDIAIRIPDHAFIEIIEKKRRELIRELMRAVRRESIQIIVGLVKEENACRLICEARKGVVPGSGFVWLFVGTYREDWWRNEAECNCSLNAKDVESVILVSSQIQKNISSSLPLGRTVAELKQDYLQRLNSWCPGTKGMPPNPLFSTTYDAVLALGLAINHTLDVLNASGVDYQPYTNDTVPGHDTSVYQSLLNSLYDTDFEGASGNVAFTAIGERIGIDIVQQMQDGNLTLIGVFDSEFGNLTMFPGATQWPGRGGVPGVYPTRVTAYAELWTVVVTIIVTLGSTILTIVVLVYIIRHHENRILRAAGQRLNYFIIAGCFTAFTTVFILALIESPLAQRMSYGVYTFFCILRLYTLVLSFTLSYGTMFARAWRIYRIFNNPFVQKRNYSDKHLMLIVGVLALIDIILVTIFVAADNYGRSSIEMEPDFDSYTICTYIGCFSQRYYIIGTGIIGLYKILQMLMFLVVISLVRKGVIERKIYDDSKWLAISLYVAAVFFLAGLPLQVLLLLNFHVGVSLLINMFWVNTITDVCIVVVFVPKLYLIVYKKVNVRDMMTQKSKFYIYSQEQQRESTLL